MIKGEVKSFHLLSHVIGVFGMFLHFISTLKILLTMRIEKDFSNIVRKIPFIKRMSLIILIKNVITSTLTVVAGYFFYKNYDQFIHKWEEMIILSIILFLLSFSLLSGILSYKRTHFPVYGKLLNLSPLSDYQIIVLLITEEILWILFQNFGFLLTLLVTLSWIIQIPIIPYLLCSIMIVLFMIFMFMIGNILWGKYQIFKIQKKIGMVRFFFYLLNAIIFLFIGFNLSNMIAYLIGTFRNSFHDSKQLLSDAFYESILNQLTKEALINMKKLSEMIIEFPINDSILFILKSGSLILPIIVIMITITLIAITLLFGPKYRHIDLIKNANKHHDLLYFYVKVIDKFFNRNHNVLFRKELIYLNRSRWIISPGVFSISLYTMESFFYAGILYGIGRNMTNDSMFISLILLFNAMIMIMHCFDVVNEFPQIFFLSSEGKNIELLRSSPLGVYQLFEAKVKLLRVILINPLIFNFCFSSILMLMTGTFTFLSVIMVLVTLVLFYVVSPLIQLFMAPYYSKFHFDDIQEVGNTFEEQELHIKSQSIPRYFILFPTLIFSYLNIFYPFYIYVPNIQFIYFLFYLVPSVLFLWVASKVVKKGLQRLERGTL